MITDNAEYARAERKLRGWTQQQVADRARVDASQVSKLEHGLSISRDAARRILCALGMTDTNSGNVPRPECATCPHWQEEKPGACSAFISPADLPPGMLTPSPRGPRCRGRKNDFCQDLLRRS